MAARWVFALLCFFPLQSTYAQSPLPDNFNPGADGAVSSLAAQADGKILAGGLFTTVGGQPRTNLARLYADGTLDNGFNPGVNGTVYSLAAQPDGKILLSGTFTIVGGQPRTNLARLNADGTLDNGFKPGAGSAIYSLLVQADGKILVGGSFTTLSGQPCTNLARLNVDGTLDNGFNSGAGGSVYALAVQADGKILLGGTFTTLSGQTRNRLARLNSDGTLESGFNPGASSTVVCLIVQADGKILVGGQFTTLGGQTRNRMARLNADGTLDSAFNPAATSTITTVYSMQLQADGRILLGGDFTALGGQTRNRLARLNSDGTLDTSFDPGANGTVYGMALQSDGLLLVGGNFTTLGGQARNRLGRLNNTDPLTQSLSYDGSTITWLRGGVSPDFWRCTFEQSTDGLIWNSLGSGTRLSGGWQLTGVLLPTDATIRARGYVAGGRYNASGGFVESLIHPLFLITQPSDQTNNAGTTATFGVSAGGGTLLYYQWQKGAVALMDGGTIAGATTATLTVSNVLGGDAGAYSVVVSNMDGSITSRQAMLTVIDPLITGQPISQQRSGGGSVAFNVTVVGTAPFNYQWRKDGVALVDGANRTGAATASLRLTNLWGGDSGGYSVMVSNQYGTLTSAVAVLLVDDLSLTGQPVSQQRNAGDNVAFNVTAVGTALSYRWWKDGLALVDGANIAGATTASLRLTNLQGADAGLYSVVVSNQ